jgi:hypothetical protein
MSLPLLVAMVVIGITAAVAAVHLTGGSVKARLAGADHARSRFAEDFPDENPLAVRITSNAETAFLDLEGGRTGVVQVFGDKFLTRIVSPKDIARIDVLRPAGLSIRLRDFTWGGGEFLFAEGEAANAVFRALHAREEKNVGEPA